MLIITRRLGETFLLGDAVVCITSVKGQSVQLGVAAPSSVKIIREELLTKDALEQRYAKVGYMDVGADRHNPSRRGKPCYYDKKKN